MNMSVHREAFEDIRETAEEELGNSLRKLVLYGSVARNEESEESDLDIFAVVEDREQKKWLEKTGTEIGVDYGVLVSIIVKTEEEYQDTDGTGFVQEVIETGEAYV